MRCKHCGKRYPFRNGAVFFLTPTFTGDEHDRLLFRVKNFLKERFPGTFLWLYRTLALFVGVSAAKAIENLPSGALILNLGSGVKRIREDVINLDCYPYRNVSVVADINALPFRDNSVDAVISEQLLEHVPVPRQSVNEIRRVLKPGGLLYVSVPFLFAFHSAPGDYYRWTISGLRELLKDFQEEKSGIAYGPSYALASFLGQWLALVLSFNSRVVFQLFSLFFLVLFVPLNLLDMLLVRFRAAQNLACAFYFIGRKR